MDVLIKGFDMPNSCEEYPLNDTKELATKSWNRRIKDGKL